jgi:hypothetical protein
MSDNCYKPNIYNPMGNFLPFDKRDRLPVCNVPITEHHQFLTPKGETFSDTFKLNFNPNPVTTSYPDITELAKYLFKDPAKCRDTGYLCRTNADQTRNLDRMGFNYPGVNEKVYQEINNNNNNNIYYLGGHTN